MDEIKKLGIFMSLGVPFILFLVLFLVLLSNQSVSGSDSVIVAVNGFAVPFENRNSFTVTSEFGRRYDPINNKEARFHSGIDLATVEGTPILASASGVVYEIGYDEEGLGNYVYIKHTTDIGTLYTGYGHMLDNSIIVEINQPVEQGQVIGQVGSTGKSTGNHLHFMIMKEKISFNEQNLINPNFVIYGLC